VLIVSASAHILCNLDQGLWAAGAGEIVLQILFFVLRGKLTKVDLHCSEEVSLDEEEDDEVNLMEVGR
jgi:hypothetical protein